MGVGLEITKMFAYIMIPVSFYHYFSHMDPEFFRQYRDDHINKTYSNIIKQSNAYVKERIANEPGSAAYNANDAFWKYGEGLKYKEAMEAKATKASE